MARKILGFVLILAAVAAIPAGAQLIGRTATVTTLPACNGTKQMALVTDATNATTLGAGGGSASVWVSCATGSWAIEEVAAVSDLTGYVQDSEAAQVSIEASGAGNDVTLIAADDVLLTPGDDFVVTPTAGSSIINAVGAGEDVSLVATDDVLLTPTDALTAAVGGAVAITTTAGAIGLTAGGTTQDITLTSVDDVILSPTDDLTLNATDDTTVAGDNVSVTSTTVTLNPGGSTVELALAAGSSTFLGSLILPIASAPPAACASGTKGTLYYDSDINKLCLCNGTNYVLVNDDSTTTGCS